MLALLAAGGRAAAARNPLLAFQTFPQPSPPEAALKEKTLAGSEPPNKMALYYGVEGHGFKAGLVTGVHQPSLPDFCP